MFILTFVVVLSLVTFLTNKQKGVSEGKAEAYSFDKYGVVSVLSLLALGVALQFAVPEFYGLISSDYTEVYAYSLGAYALLCFGTVVVTNSLRAQAIQRLRDQIEQLYSVLEPLVGVDLKKGIDFNNVPFEFEYDPQNKKQIQKITVNVKNTAKFTDSAVTQCVFNLNKYLPYKTWFSAPNFPEKVCVFVGNDLPPELAMYPGSDFRPWNWIPLGLNGQGELGWNLGAKESDVGASAYVYEENGKRAKTVLVSKAPQALVVGSTGGGKAIALDEYVEVYSSK